MTSFAGLSQNGNDTICFPRTQAKNVLIAAEQSKILKQQVTILNERIINYQTIIATLNSRDSVTVATYVSQIKSFEEEKKVYQDQIAGYEKIVRKLKRQKFITGLVGSLATGAAIFIAVTK